MQTPTRLFLLLGVSFQVSHGFPWWDPGLETSLWAGRALLPGPWCSHQDVEGLPRLLRRIFFEVLPASGHTLLWEITHFEDLTWFNYKKWEILWHYDIVVLSFFLFFNSNCSYAEVKVVFLCSYSLGECRSWYIDSAGWNKPSRSKEDDLTLNNTPVIE